jgi:prepilin-type N-terminal cleavage/methylation domain-containing protein
MSKNINGFTLIELLVVISIIGLLASVVLASVSSARAKARDASRVQEMKQIQTALDLYYADQKQYPNVSGVITQLLNSSTGYLKDYIKIPADVVTNLLGALTGGAYFKSNGTAYELFYRTETAKYATRSDCNASDMDTIIDNGYMTAAGDFVGCIGQNATGGLF